MAAESFTKVRVAGVKDELLFPDFGLSKPNGVSDDMIVKEVEQEAVVLAGPYLSKERDSCSVMCLEQIRVNHSFARMKVAYGPAKLLMRRRGAQVLSHLPRSRSRSQPSRRPRSLVRNIRIRAP